MKKGLVFEILLLLLVITAFIMAITAVSRMEDMIAPLQNVGGRANAVMRAHDSSRQMLFTVDTAAHQAAWDAVYDMSSAVYNQDVEDGYPIWMSHHALYVPEERERIKVFTASMKKGLDKRLAQLSSIVNMPADNYDFLVEESDSLKITGFASTPVVFDILSPQEYVRTPIYSIIGVRWGTLVEHAPRSNVGMLAVRPSFTTEVEFSAFDKLEEIVQALWIECDQGDFNESERMNCVDVVVTRYHPEDAGLSWSGRWKDEVYFVDVTTPLTPPWRAKPPQIKMALIFAPMR